MNTLQQGIESAIQSAFEEFSRNIASKYDNIQEAELEEIWNNISQNMKISVSFNTKNTKISSNPKPNPNPNPRSEPITQPTEKSNSVKQKCKFILTRGANKGKHCSFNAKEGKEMCSKHSSSEGVTKEQKTLPKNKNTKTVSSTVKKTSPTKQISRVLRMNSTLEKLWHPETGLVFSSKREAIGYIQNNTLLPLNQEYIEICKQWNFKYSENGENPPTTTAQSSENDFEEMERKAEEKAEKEFEETLRKNENHKEDTTRLSAVATQPGGATRAIDENEEDEDEEEEKVTEPIKNNLSNYIHGLNQQATTVQKDILKSLGLGEDEYEEEEEEKFNYTGRDEEEDEDIGLDEYEEEDEEEELDFEEDLEDDDEDE